MTNKPINQKLQKEHKKKYINNYHKIAKSRARYQQLVNAINPQETQIQIRETDLKKSYQQYNGSNSKTLDPTLFLSFKHAEADPMSSQEHQKVKPRNLKSETK